jgi:hypothetical protein
LKKASSIRDKPKKASPKIFAAFASGLRPLAHLPEPIGSREINSTPAISFLNIL